RAGRHDLGVDRVLAVPRSPAGKDPPLAVHQVHPVGRDLPEAPLGRLDPHSPAVRVAHRGVAPDQVVVAGAGQDAGSGCHELAHVAPHDRSALGRRRISQVSTGAVTAMPMPQANIVRNTVGRSSSGAFARVSAPTDENGVESTTVAEIASAMVIAATPISPWRRNGTASGMSTPSRPALEANAEVNAATRHSR